MEEARNKQFIISDPNIRMGKPTIAGTRLTVELILEKLAAGETSEQILDTHPRLTREAIHGCISLCCPSLAGRCSLSNPRAGGMNFLADEGVEANRFPSSSGRHVVWYVAEMEPTLSDHAILDKANREKVILLTTDKDFGELVFRQRRIALGVVLIRLAGLSPERKAEIVSLTLRKHSLKLPQAFAVITLAAFRIRRRKG